MHFHFDFLSASLDIILPDAIVQSAAAEKNGERVMLPPFNNNIFPLQRIYSIVVYLSLYFCLATTPPLYSLAIVLKKSFHLSFCN
jgi:hypothetical protein